MEKKYPLFSEDLSYRFSPKSTISRNAWEKTFFKKKYLHYNKCTVNRLQMKSASHSAATFSTNFTTDALSACFPAFIWSFPFGGMTSEPPPVHNRYR